MRERVCVCVCVCVCVHVCVSYMQFVSMQGYRKYGLVHNSQVSSYIAFTREHTDEEKKAELVREHTHTHTHTAQRHTQTVQDLLLMDTSVSLMAWPLKGYVCVCVCVCARVCVCVYTG